MAVIGGFREAETRNDRVHPTVVDCEWQVVRSETVTLLQLTTFGSPDREIPGKASQTLQVDRAGAAVLIDLIRRAFPDLETEADPSDPATSARDS
jgi:hypothetical protein